MLCFKLSSNCPIRSGDKDRRIDDGLPMISKDHELSAKEAQIKFQTKLITIMKQCRSLHT